MKAFILCVYILGYVSFISTDTVMSKLQTRPEDPGKELVDICLSQVNLTREEAYNVENILNNVHEQPEMKEKRRKHGCAIECILKKMNWMEGTELKEERIYAIVTKLLPDHLLQAKAQKLIRDCAKEVRDTTPERCEKGVTAMTSNLADSEIKRQFKNAVRTVEDNFDVCLTENNITQVDWYKEEEIMTGVHAEPENEERTKKLGCTIVCVLKKENLMEGSNIQEGKVHAKINREVAGYPGEAQIHKVARDCIKEVRNITEECEKGFALFACATKAVHKLQKHEEHERVETDENEEAEQTV